MQEFESSICFEQSSDLNQPILLLESERSAENYLHRIGSRFFFLTLTVEEEVMQHDTVAQKQD